MSARRESLGVRLARRPELLLSALIVVLVVAVGLKEPSFWAVETLFNVLRDSMVTMVFALGVLLVLIAGGIDVSFLAIGIFAAYCTVGYFPDGLPGGSLSLFVVAMLIGAGLGLVNAAVVLGARVSTLIATLATSAIFMGALFAFVGGTVLPTLPESLTALGRHDLFVVDGAVRGTSRLNITILVVVVAAVLVALLLRWTVWGRCVYAVGGDEEAAHRAGVPVARTKTLVFAVSGALYGLAGILHVTLSGRADPTTFSGGELDILAAVVLGGALITGGRGSVLGVALGVALIMVIQASLVPLEVPTIWQKATVGALLLLGVGLQTVTARARAPRPILEELTERPQIDGARRLRPEEVR